MSIIYQVIEEIILDPEYHNENQLFISLDENKAIENAKKHLERIALNTDNYNGRVNLQWLKNLINQIPDVKKTVGYSSFHSILVFETELDNELSCKNNKLFWNPELQDLKNIFEKQIQKVMMEDLNITLFNCDIEELWDLYLKNEKLLVETKPYGVIKNSSDLLNLLSSHD